MKSIFRITRRYQLKILVHEIHADLVYPPHQHTPLAALALPDDHLNTAVAPSKTFNILGLGLSSLIVDHPADRLAIQSIFEQWHISARNPFSIAAFDAAYAFSGDWKDALLKYLQTARDEVLHTIQNHLPGIDAICAEGTFLIWLDCRQLGLSDQQLANFFWHQA